MDRIPDIIPMFAASDDNRVDEILSNPHSFHNTGFIAERKYDGARYLIRKELDGSVSITSRQISKKTGRPVDKTENVPHLVKFADGLPPGTVLDGEIITDINGSSSDVTSIMGSLPGRALELQKEKGWVKYVAFDILYFAGKSTMELPWYKRRQLLENVISNWTVGLEDDYILLSEYQNCSDETFEWYKEIVESGGEGLILKNIYSNYYPGLRPKDAWLKVKKYKTFDVVIMGYTEPTKEYTGKELDTWIYFISKYTGERVSPVVAHRCRKHPEEYLPVTKYYWMGWIGAIRFGQYKDGKLVEIGQTSGMPEEIRDEISKNKEKYIGKVIEVGAMEQIKKTGALRHPRFLRFREDKNPEDCILGEN